jgi:antitoxin (DNA-binding transcriptional repressor) of toxin-antitoxin stability system
MRNLNIREMRNLLGQLDSLVEKEQELIVTRNKQAIARILPVKPLKPRPTHTKLRELQQVSKLSSADLIRQDRDDR